MNGWCIASQRPSSSFHSNIGKSTTHSSACAAPAVRSNLRDSSSRSSPSACAATAGLSATASSRSPGWALSSRPIAARSSSLRNLAIGERHEPSSSTNAHTRPPAPKRLTSSVSSSSSRRGTSRAPALIPRTTSAVANTLNSLPATASLRSWISSPNRVSGRSEPKRAIASS